MLKYIEEAIIDSPAETIFDVMTDFASYRAWNPWIVEAKATSEHDVIKVKSKLGRQTMAVRHRILTKRPATEFRWCDLGWFTAIAYGERARFLEKLPSGKVSYRVELTVTGFGARLVKVLYGKALASGLKAETVALKARAEALRV
jgi:hypothetical protein